MNKFAIGCGGVLVIILLSRSLRALALMGTYNRWSNCSRVSTRNGRRCKMFISDADLIPNLVNTVRERSPFREIPLPTEITNARASVGRVQLDPNKAPTDAAQLGYQAIPSRARPVEQRTRALLVVSERYPELRDEPELPSGCRRNSKARRIESQSSAINSTKRCRAITPP